jgi:uncharacterized protein HemX
MFAFLAIILNALILAVAIYGFRQSQKAVGTYDSTRRARQSVRAEADAMRGH